MTFKKSEGIKEVCKVVPLERMLLETDAPYMAPGKFRGKTCHSGMIPILAAQIAELHKVDIETVFKVTTQNCFDMYGIK